MESNYPYTGGDQIWSDIKEDKNKNGSSNKRKHDEGSMTSSQSSTSCSSSPTWEDQKVQTKYIRLENRPNGVNSSDDNTKSDSDNIHNWQHVEDLVNNLTDFDDHFNTGLGADINSTSYNLNEALLSLPSLIFFKKENPSSPQQVQNENSNSRGADEVSSYNHQTSPCHTDGSENNHLEDLITLCPRSNSNEVTSTGGLLHSLQDGLKDIRFQYILQAATSIATKVNEETLTYLNQGQSYGIKFKRNGPLLSSLKGKVLKSVIRVSFHDRRLQYTEREQMSLWRASRPGDRILDVDLPLSYGIYDLEQDSASCNTLQFLWDPSKEVGVYIKVNCISTEFTPKKHGGEKGVPFRIQVDTFVNGDKLPQHLNSAACQIKVFKLKGADRKHKQDKEKIMKRPAEEHDQYQQSCDYTVFTEVPCNVDYPTSISPVNTSPKVDSPDSKRDPKNIQLVKSNVSPDEIQKTKYMNGTNYQDGVVTLKHEFTFNQVQTWLQRRDFGSFLMTFANYNGMDMLRLSKDDLKTLCGLSEGIRLYNSLHPELMVHKRKIYVLINTDTMVYHPLFLYTLTSLELWTKLVNLLNITQTKESDVYIQGPNEIHVIVTDELVKHIQDESTFLVEILQDINIISSKQYRVLIKPMSLSSQPPCNILPT